MKTVSMAIVVIGFSLSSSSARSAEPSAVDVQGQIYQTDTGPAFSSDWDTPPPMNGMYDGLTQALFVARFNQPDLFQRNIELAKAQSFRILSPQIPSECKGVASGFLVKHGISALTIEFYGSGCQSTVAGVRPQDLSIVFENVPADDDALILPSVAVSISPIRF